MQNALMKLSARRNKTKKEQSKEEKMRETINSAACAKASIATKKKESVERKLFGIGRFVKPPKNNNNIIST